MKHTVCRLIVVFAFVYALALPASSQPPPPQDFGQEGNQDPEPTSVGGGLLFLLALAGGYGAKKVYDGRRKLR